MQRGFLDKEFQNRVSNAQSLMAKNDLSALLLTTEPDVRYFTGFLTQFWQSPARPWFLIVPVSGRPIAVIPSIGHSLMNSTWIDDISRSSLQRAAHVLEKRESLKLAYVDCLSASLAGPDSDGLLDW